MNTYIELHCHSHYSLLDGASSPEELVQRAATLDMPALAITDHDGLYGAVEFWHTARNASLHPIIGAEVTLSDGGHLTLLAETRAGYSNLCRLISRAQLAGQEQGPVLTWDLLQAHAEGLICLSGCRQSPVARAVRAKDYRRAEDVARQLHETFGPDHFYVELQRHLLPNDRRLTHLLARLADHVGVGIVATNNVHYATPAGQALHDVLTCIRHHTTLELGCSLLWPNSERYLKSPAQMVELFADLPQAIENTRRIAERCHASLDLSAYRLPDFPVPEGETPLSYLYQLCQEGARRRYQPVTPAMSRQLAHELDVIERANLTTFFLVVWDICRSPTSIVHSPSSNLHPPSSLIRGFLEIRGSAFLQLVHEIQGVPRHLSIHNGGMLITACPLIDIVPVERATMPGRVVVQWNKDSVEDAGLIKVDLLGLRTLSVIHEAVALIREHEGTEIDIQSLPLDDPRVYDLLCAADTIGAFQVESRAQAQLLPRLQPRRFEDIVISVAIIRPGPIQSAREQGGRGAGEKEPGSRQDLLFSPAPLHLRTSAQIHPYLRRRAGEEPVEYLHPALEKPLAETLGVMLFQEQILKVAMAIAGFSPGEADALRRAMSRARSKAAMEALRPKFVRGAEAQGIEADVAHTIFDQIAGYAGYGFCKSHAASFALIAYATCWLKVYHPAAFYCALANCSPMGFYPLEVVINDAKRHNVPILRPDINRSLTICTLERVPDNSEIRNSKFEIRLGFRFVKGVGDAGGERIEAAREAGAFRDLHDFCRRTRLPCRAIERLILVGAMDGWGLPRRKLLWELGKTCAERSRSIDYREDVLDLELPPDDVELPALTREERVDLEYSYLDLNVGEHVMELYRDQLAAQGVLDSHELASVPDGTTVRVAGSQVIRQRPSTAHGMVFVTLESERGLINVVVTPDVYERYRQVWRGCRLLVVRGVVERRHGVVNVTAHHVAGISPADLA